MRLNSWTKFFQDGKFPILHNAIGGLLTVLTLFILGYLTRIAIANVDWVHIRSSQKLGYFAALSLATMSLGLYTISKLTLELKKPNRERYRIDEFYSYVWRWTAISSDFEVYGLEAYCPKDDMKIQWLEDRYGESNCAFCPHCGTKSNELQSMERLLRERAKLDIGRRLRTGDWRKAKLRIQQIQREFETESDSKVKKKRVNS